MNVMVIGTGAREHALCYAIAKSPLLTKLYAVSGNAGIADIAKCIALDVLDFDGIYNACLEKKIELVIVGPEVPLCAGIVDFLTAKGIKTFGPQQSAAILEGSKAFAKDFMLRNGIKTAEYKIFKDYDTALAEIDIFGFPVVIKADGLAAGKGVLIAENKAEAEDALKTIFLDKKFGDAGKEIVLEEFLTGVEASQICILDKNTILPLSSSQDYKRAEDGDKGLNTGGMGNYSPSKLYTPELEQRIDKEILQPFLKGLQKENITYSGFIFIGLMIKNGEPKVIEFNVRFGDPEAESILPRLESDLLELILKALDNDLKSATLKWKKEHSVVVILASGGYPLAYKKGFEITGIDENEIVFHAGTKFDNDKVVTNGGRVLAVTALGESLEQARQKAYAIADKIDFEGKMYRKDIAKFYVTDQRN